MNNLVKIVAYEDQGRLEICPETMFNKGSKLGKKLLEKEKERVLKLGEVTSAEDEIDSKISEIRHTAQRLATDFEQTQLPDLKELVHLEQIAEQVFGNNSPESILAAFYLMKSNSAYYKRKGFQYQSRTADEVEKRLEELEMRKQAQETIKTFIICLKEQSTERIETEAELNDLLHLLKRHAGGARNLNDQEQQRVRDLVRLINQEFKLEFSGNLHEVTRKILVNFELIEPEQHLIFEKFDLYQIKTNKYSAEIQTIREKLKSLENSKRQNLTNLKSYTIDDQDTADMDDALSLRQTPEGFELGIHISDISYLISEKSALDKLALSKGTSIYCPDQNFNMLPAELAEELASLVAGENRPVLSILFKLDSQFNILKFKLTPAYIQVKEKLDYDSLDQELETGSNQLANDLHSATAKNESIRLANGANTLPKSYAQLKYDGQNIAFKVIDENSVFRKLVAEAMIMYNHALAVEAQRNFLPMFFRAQEAVSSEELQNSIQFKPSYHHFTARPHASLGLSAYLQATSPIRRYMDLINQRQVTHFLETKRKLYDNKSLKRIEHKLFRPLGLAKQITKETQRYWQMRYLQNINPEGTYVNGTVIKHDQGSVLVRLDESLLISKFKSNTPLKPAQEVQLKITSNIPAENILRLELA